MTPTSTVDTGAASASRTLEELEAVISIARALSSERDIRALLGLVLEKSRQLTGADAGSIYIVEGRSLNPRERTLRFMISQNDSLKLDFSEFTLLVDEKSIVGRAVTSGQIINIPDLYALSEPGKNPWSFRHDRQFDQRTGYHGRSMLTVPMINQRDEVIGVVQLINKRRPTAAGTERQPLRTDEDFDSQVIPFDVRAEELSSTLAAQAGVSLENTLLYEDIRRLFEGFVNAAVTAIEQRDPTTSGHSHRVAQLTVGLAQIIDGQSTGRFRDIRFSPDDLKEIEYAGLLHDFGKVGVREQVLVKAKKLYEPSRELVLARFDYIAKSLEAESLKKKCAAVQAGGSYAVRWRELELELAVKLAQLADARQVVLAANEPTVLTEGSFGRLHEIARLMYEDGTGNLVPYLMPEEVVALSVSRGSLTEGERLEIESHVVHTYNFLENIPWGRTLGKIPLIAGAHHEKLDGTGYPRGLSGNEIRVETRMMTIADIFDALTAKDRPYKRALPLDRALDILGSEVKAGKCDADLFALFVEAKVWQRVI